MKFRIDPDKVYLVVFLIFLGGASFKAAGEYVYDRFVEQEPAAAVQMVIPE